MIGPLPHGAMIWQRYRKEITFAYPGAYHDFECARRTHATTEVTLSQSGRRSIAGTIGWFAAIMTFPIKAW
jgi:hypothetical protein